MFNPRIISVAATIAALNFGVIGAASAQDTHLFKDDAPSVDEYADILFADPADGVPLTRGIVFKADAGAETEEAAEPAEPSPWASSNPSEELQALMNPEPAKVGVLIEFAFNSSDVPVGYHEHLDNLAAALALPEAEGRSITVLGHTDTVGDDSYNSDLSIRRASAVRAYLVAKGVSSDRVSVQGMGETQPLADIPGDAAENRRVEFQAS